MSARTVWALVIAASLGCAADPAATDAGAGDAGSGDGGTPDAARVDAGGGADAGRSDANVADGSLEADAAPPDAGPAGAAPPTFVGWWGGRGTAPGQFIEPSSVELDGDGFVYVAGHENRFQKFTADGELVEIFGSAGTADGQFNHPHGLAVDRRRGDLVYVGDQENHRLQVFTTSGEFVREWGDALFRHIHDVGIDPDTGDLFVGDYELDTVRRFDPSGALQATYGGAGIGPGEFRGVWGISTDSAGDVYVADTFNRRVQKLDRDGNFLAEWIDFRGAAFVKPTGVFVDARDVVYVCDSLADAVLVFAPDGTPLERWDLEAIVGFRSEPEDIVIDAGGRHIYLGEVLNHRVLHLERSPS